MIRKATINDAQAVKTIKDITWPSDATSETHIQSILSNSNQVILIDEIQSTMTGFAAAFSTQSQNGDKRWEFDLLAVHPQHQGRGIAKRLISAITEIGQQRGSKFARALIQIENTPSQRAFAACGYATNGDVQALYISDRDSKISITSPQNAYLIPVSTLNYRGVWIEGELKSEAFALGQAMRALQNLDIAGAVIPASNKQAIATAEANGFIFVSHFQTWIYNFK